MTPLKVFVSSTSVDLKDHRQVINDLIARRLNQQLIAMEDFGSYPLDATEVSTARVDDCDLFLGIYAFRYGHTPEDGGPSITEMEYDYARLKGKRCLCYFMDEAQRPATGDEDEGKQRRLALFKRRIDSELVRSTFTSPEDLSMKVASDFARLLQGDPLGYSLNDMTRRWFKSEFATFSRIVHEELGDPSARIASPLAELWEDFLNADCWHDQLRRKIESIIKVAADIPKLSWIASKAEEIDFDVDYNTILQSIRNLITDETMSNVSRALTDLKKSLAISVQMPEHKIEDSNDAKLQDKVRTLRRELIETQRYVREPQYGRCFLITGSLGSGKTHFLSSLLKNDPPSLEPQDTDNDSSYENDKDEFQDDIDGQSQLENQIESDYQDYENPVWDNNYLLLLLDKDYDNKPLDDIVLKSIQAATDMAGWRSLEEFDKFLEMHKESPEGGKEGNKIKLVIAIDDLERWLATKLDLQAGKEELIQFISRNSKLKNVHWIITLQTTEYERVVDSKTSQFWQEYGFTGSLIEKQAPRILTWLSLDDFNREERIGLEIVRQVLRSEAQSGSGSDDDLLVLETLSGGEMIWRYLSNPFIAWVLLGLRSVLPIKTIVNLNFIRFIDYFWEKRSSDIESNRLSSIQLEQAIGLIAKYLAGSGNFAPPYLQLVHYISKAAKERYVVEDLELSKLAVTSLEQGNLLKRRVDISPDYSQDPLEREEIQFETFWQWHLARQLRNSPDTQRQDKLGSRFELENWFGLVESDSIKEGVFEFLLLLLDLDAVTKNLDRAFIEYLLRVALDSDLIPEAAIWFAGPKASPAFQQSLAELALADKSRFDDRRTLFAFMYFMSEALPGILAPPTRLALLQPHFNMMAEHYLDSYYIYILKRLFAEIEDTDVLVACMRHLSGCEVMEVTSVLASITIAALARLADEQPEAMWRVAIKYLQEIQEEAAVQYGQRHNRRQRYFYWEWVLCEFCQSLVRIDGLYAYGFLAEHNWYDSKPLKIHFPVSLEMRREANLALGYHYRWRAKSEERGFFAKRVQELVDSNDKQMRETAFYLIRHTVPTEGGAQIPVRSIFDDMLKEIFFDARLQKTINRHIDTFESSLHDFNKLKEQRQQLLEGN